MNAPYKKVLSLAKEKYGDVLARDSLRWTPDDRLLVCCSERLLVVNVMMNQQWNLNSNQEIFTTLVEEALSIVDIPDFSFVDGMLNTERGFQHLKDVERQEIMSDPFLMDVGFIQFSQSKILKKATCSTFFGGERKNFFIACVTFGARVFIFYRDGHEFKPFECSPMIKKQVTSNTSLPMVLKGNSDFEKYKYLMHSMSTVEICWSHLFAIETSQPFSLLVTGSRNGDVHIWRVGAKTENKDLQFEWQYTDKYHSEVLSFAWLSKSPSEGLLAIGYVDGSIRCLRLTVSTDQSVLVTEIMADLHCDNLSVSGMDFGKTSQGTDILVACKQYFLLVYTVSGDASCAMKYCNHCMVDSVLPLFSVSLRGMYGVASPQDSAVIAFEVQQTSGEICIAQRMQEFDKLSGRPNVPYSCCGAALSPSSALCFSVQKTDCYVQAQRRQKETGKQIMIMNIPFDFTVEKMIQNIRDPEVSSKDIILNLCLHIKDLAQIKEEKAPKMDQISDILKLLQQIPGDRGLQVALAVMKFLKSYLQASGKNKCPEWLPIAYEDGLKKRLSQYATSIMKLSKTPSVKDSKIISSLRALWHFEKEGSADDTPRMDGQQTCHLLCSICGTEFSLDNLLTVKCTKGHKATLCCLSCQPCQDLDTRKCETCGALALSKHALADSLLLQDRHNCSICGSHLRESAWT